MLMHWEMLIGYVLIFHMIVVKQPLLTSLHGTQLFK
jgi:hypothetical protein